jgi:hypothetical protein
LFAPAASCIGNGTGLTAEYFSNTVVADPFPATATITRTEPNIDFNWNGGSPAGISADNFKARFSGFIQTTDEGTYTFYATADDGVRLWVNNRLVIDGWVDQPATEYKAVINLAGCSAYPIRLEYYERTGDASCKLEWSGPLTDRQVVPTAQLLPQLGVSSSIVLYPNPASKEITIASKTGFSSGDMIAFYDMLGRKMKEIQVGPAEDGRFRLIISVSSFSAGLYVAEIISGGTVSSIKFVKQ